MRILMAEHMAYSSLLQVGSHHLARAFAKRGHDVLWIAYPWHVPKNPLRLFYDNELGRSVSLWRQGLRGTGRLKEILPFTFFPWKDWPLLRNERMVEWSLSCTIPSISRLLEREGFLHVDLLWLTYPQFSHIRNLLSYDCLVHRMTDDYEAFAGAPPGLARVERDIQAEADVVITAVSNLAERARRNCENVHVISNAVDFKAVRAAEKVKAPPEYEGLTGPIFLYTGGIYAAWFDVSAIEAISRAFPEGTLMLVGPYDEAGERLASLPNVRLLGRQPYERMPSFWFHSDVGLIPFLDNDIGRTVNPLKLFEYCASGLPTVVSSLDELRALNAPVSYARDAGEWVQGCRSAMTEGSLELVEYARRNSWEQRADRILELIRAS